MEDLAAKVWHAYEDGRSEKLTLAADLDGFGCKPSKCHENAARWAAAHPGCHVVRGWLITGHGIAVKHSVIRTEAGTLLDVTPRIGDDARRMRDFIVWDRATPEEFGSMPNQLIHPGASIWTCAQSQSSS